jgi:HEAT repeat protein
MKRILPAIILIFGLIIIAYEIHNAFQPATTEELITAASQGSFIEVKSALASKDPKARIQAVQALTSLGTDEAFSLLEIATHDKATVVRVALVNRLSSVPEKKALPILKELIDDHEFGVARDAIIIIQKITGKDYHFRFDASPQEKSQIIAECKHDIESIK